VPLLSGCVVVLPLSGVFADGPFLLPSSPFTPAAASDPAAPVLLPLLDGLMEFESVPIAGPFLLPG
jgi:hypothetical protein